MRGAGKWMRRTCVIGGLILAAFLLDTPAVLAGPGEDGVAAYNRGDYVPAMRLFRPLAEAGNSKAQSSVRALMWFSLAAKRGDARANAELREVTDSMTPAEISQAQEMMQACETSNYRA